MKKKPHYTATRQGDTVVLRSYRNVIGVLTLEDAIEFAESVMREATRPDPAVLKAIQERRQKILTALENAGVTNMSGVHGFCIPFGDSFQFSPSILGLTELAKRLGVKVPQ